MNENIEAAAQAPRELDPHGREAAEAARAEMRKREDQRERARVALVPTLKRLGEELALFLTAAERSGFSAGMGEQWGKVLSLVWIARLKVTEFLPLSAAERAKLENTGMLVPVPTELVQGFRLLEEALGALTFAVLWNEAGAWTERIPADVLDRIRAFAREVAANRAVLESGPVTEGFEMPAVSPPATVPAAGTRPRMKDRHKRAARAWGWIQETAASEDPARGEARRVAFAWVGGEPDSGENAAERRTLLRECPAYEGVRPPTVETFARYIREVRRTYSTESVHVQAR